jgi:hypothetical protein
MASLDVRVTCVVACVTTITATFGVRHPGGSVTDQRLWNMARQAAALLPGAPSSHDSFGYLAWEELVLSTARRLLQFGADVPAGPPTLQLEPVSARVDASALISLAGLLAARDDAACERALSDGVSVSRGEHTTPVATPAAVHTCHRPAAHARSAARTPARLGLAFAPRV